MICILDQEWLQFSFYCYYCKKTFWKLKSKELMLLLQSEVIQVILHSDKHQGNIGTCMWQKDDNAHDHEWIILLHVFYMFLPLYSGKNCFVTIKTYILHNIKSSTQSYHKWCDMYAYLCFWSELNDAFHL